MSKVCCAARGCTNTPHNCTLSFFQFPNENTRATLWLSMVERGDLLEKIPDIHKSSRRLCAEHFSPNMFANVQHNRLRRNAVPTIFKSCNDYSTQPKSRIADTPLDEDVQIIREIIIPKVEPDSSLEDELRLTEPKIERDPLSDDTSLDDERESTVPKIKIEPDPLIDDTSPDNEMEFTVHKIKTEPEPFIEDM